MKALAVRAPTRVVRRGGSPGLHTFAHLRLCRGAAVARKQPHIAANRGGRGALVALQRGVAAEEVWAIEDSPVGGTLTTAGGLLVKGGGESLGFYNAAEGTELKMMDTQARTFAGAITYMHEGEQYIAQVVGASAYQETGIHTGEVELILALRDQQGP